MNNMKKGDIVKLKEGLDLSQPIWKSNEWEREQIQNSQGKFEELTVTEREVLTACCAQYELVKFAEVPGRFNASAFEVVLEAGEPDVEQLMKEAAQERLASVII